MKHCLLHRVALMYPVSRGRVNGHSMGLIAPPFSASHTTEDWEIMGFVGNFFNWVGEWLVVTLKYMIIIYICIFLNFEVPSSMLEWVWLGLVTGAMYGVITVIFEYIGGHFEFPQLRESIQERRAKKESWQDESEHV